MLSIMIGKRIKHLRVVLRTVVALVALLLLWASPTLSKTATGSAVFIRYRITGCVAKMWAIS
jgi:hypothetical protein